MKQEISTMAMHRPGFFAKVLTLALAAVLVPPQVQASDDRQLSLVQQSVVDVAASTGDALITATLDRPDPVYAIGDVVGLTVTLGRAGYLTVLNVVPDGSTTVLFPKASDADGYVPANTALSIPGGGHAIRVGAASGLEVVKVIASHAPLDLAGISGARTLSEFTTFPADQAGMLARSLAVVSSDSGGPGIFAERSLTLTTVAAAADATIIAEPAAGPGFGIVILADKPSYQLGEPVTFTVMSRTACALTLIEFAPDGINRVLFPSPGRGGRIEANLTYRIPGPSSIGRIVAAGPAGVSTVYAVCSADGHVAAAAPTILAEVQSPVRTDGSLPERALTTLLPAAGGSPEAVAQAAVNIRIRP